MKTLIILSMLLLCSRAHADGLVQETDKGGVYKYSYRFFNSNENDIHAKKQIQNYCHGDYKVIERELVHAGALYTEYNHQFFTESKNTRKYYLVRFECDGAKPVVANN